MTKNLTLLFASAALSVGVCLPAWSAIRSAGAPVVVRAVPAALGQAAERATLIFVDDDEDESEGSAAKRSGDRNDEEDDDACEEDEGSCGTSNNAAPAGNASPPQNGLFGSGAAPKAQVN